jgi:hypothetical protein
MTKHLKNENLPDSINSALEDIFLEAKDDELLSLVSESDRPYEEVRSLVVESVANWRANSGSDVISSGKLDENLHRPRKEVRTRSEQVEFLLNLVARRPALLPQISTVFSSNEHPSDEDIDDLVKRLIELRLTSNSNSPKK